MSGSNARRIRTWAAALVVVAAAQPAEAQPGRVLSHQKISDTEGGFTGIPAQAHRPRLSGNLLDQPVRRETIDDPPAPRLGPVRTSPALPRSALARGPFQSIQVNVDEFGNNILGDAANEPSIAVDPTAPNRIVIGWRQFDDVRSNFRQAGWAWSNDGGRTWTFPGVIEPGIFRSDPVLDADADGNFYYYSATIRANIVCDLFKSTNGGRTWTGPVSAYGGDKAWIAIDRTGGIGHGNFYAAWDHAGCCGDDWFTRSTDGGAVFDPPVPIPERPIWGVTTVGPTGAVYIAGRRRSTNTQFVVAKSSTVQDPDNPLAFDFAVQVDLGGTHQFNPGFGPNPGGLMGQVWIATDHSDEPTQGNIYILSSVEPPGTDPLDVMFARSTDGGLTWSEPVRVNDDKPLFNVWQWFGTMSVAPNGRIDVIWNDTRNSPDNFRISELFYSFSTDAGETWSANVPISPPWDSHLGWPNQNKIGDYYDMVSDELGAHLSWSATFNGEQDVYYLRIGDYDCNGNGVGDTQDIAGGISEDCNENGIPDECEIAAGTVEDTNGNGIPDECECDPCDMDCDGMVNSFDIEPFLELLFGGGDPCDSCTGDVDGNGDINSFDIEPFLECLFP